MIKKRFNSITPKLIAQRKSVHELCRQFSRSPSKGNLKRIKALFQYCGENVIIESGIHMDYGDNVSIGERVYININCTILDGVIDETLDAISDRGNDKEFDGVINAEKYSHDKTLVNESIQISIGDDCLIGPNVQLLAVSHDVDPCLRKTDKFNYVQSITLANNVWLGAGVIVLAGVTIGDNSVIGAGSVVTKNVKANSLYAGNPAIKVRDL